jgi:hypothetical protein
MATTRIQSNPAVIYRDETKRLYRTGYIVGVAAPAIAYGASQFLRKNTSNQLVACVTSAASTATSGGIQYVAQQNAPVTGSGVNTIQDTVEVIRAEMVFEGDAVSGTLADTDIGTQCGINVANSTTLFPANGSQGSVVTIDKGNTNAHVEIVDVGYVFDPASYNASDINPRVRFRVLGAAIDAAEAA